MQICMDWRGVKFDWTKARGFLVAAEEGSLSAAARALGLAQPTLGRQVEGLEQELGVVLFERVGRGLRLTPQGLELLEHARAMGEAAGRLSLAAVGQAQEVAGTIAISASETYATHLLPPLLAELRAAHPGIRTEIVVTNAASDLRRREADIAIRSFRPTEPDLIARKVADCDAALYAAPAYLDRLGPVRKLAHLSAADFIDLDRDGMLMKGLNAVGLTLEPGNFPLMTDSYNVMWALVRQGIGIGVLDTLVGDADPGVVRVPPGKPLFTFPMWLVAHREVMTSRRIRIVYDLLAAGLRR